MAKNLKSGIIITGDANGAIKAAKLTRKEMELLNKTTKRASANTNEHSKSIEKMTGFAKSGAKALAALGTAFAGSALTAKLVSVEREFGVLNSSLKTVTGSTESANEAFLALEQLSKRLPVTVPEITEAFIKMRALGLDPTEEALVSFSNTSAAMGKSLEQFVEAVADASTGEFERLKEFGIKSKTEANSISFTFQGVTTKVKKNAEDITGYLQGIGDTAFAGAAAERMATLDGQISNLGVAWDGLFRTINEQGAANVISESVQIATEAVEDFTDLLGSGALAAYIENIGIRFSNSFGTINGNLEQTTELFGLSFGGIAHSADETSDFIIDAFRKWPENVAAFVKILGVEFGYLVNSAFLTGEEIAESLNPKNWFDDDLDDIKEEIASLQEDIAEREKKLSQKRLRARQEVTKAQKEDQAKLLELQQKLVVLSEKEQKALDAKAKKEKALLDAREQSINDILNKRDEEISAGNALDLQGIQLLQNYKSQKSELKTINEVLKDIEGTTGDVKTAAKDYEKEWTKAGDRVASTLQNAIATGDWAGIGQTVGGVFAGELANVVTDSLGSSLGLLAPIGGALVGGLVGGLVTGDLFGDVTDPTEGRQAAQGTGSILGGINEKSASIARSNDLIESSTSELVNINTGMLNALRGLDQNIVNAVSAAARGRSGLDFGLPSAGTFASGIEGGARSQLAFSTFGFSELFTAGSTSKQIDEGIQIAGGKIEDIIDNTLIEAFATFKVRKNYLDDYDLRERFQVLGDEVTRTFGEAFAGIVDSVSSGASALGIDQASIAAALDSVVIETQKISLEGLDSAAQQAEIEAVFSKVFDDTVTAVVPYLEEMQRSGEGLGETLARVTTQFELAKEAQSVLGFQVANTFGELWGEAATALIPFGEVLGQAVLPVEFMVQAADDLIARTGGIEAFSSALSSYEKNFLSEAEQTENLSRRLGEALGDLPLPETREGFRALFEAQNASTVQGRENIATLLQLQSQADQYYDALESSAESAGNSIESLAVSLGGLQSATDSALSALRGAVNSQIAELRSEQSALQGSLKDAEGSTDALLNRLSELADQEKRSIEQRIDNTKSAIKSETDERLRANSLVLAATKAGVSELERELSGVSSALESVTSGVISQGDLRTQALKVLRSALSSGDFSGVGDAAGVLSNIDASNFGSRAELQKAQISTKALLSSIQSKGGAQLSEAERTIASLEAQTSVIRSSGDAQIAAADQRHSVEVGKIEQLLINAENQVNESRGIKEQALTLEEVLAGIQESVTAETEIRNQLEEGNFSQEIERLNSLVENAEAQVDLLRGVDESLSTVAGALSNLQVVASAEADALSVNVPQFADGGSYKGGMALVGERGPELINFNSPGQITNNSDLKELLSQRELLLEVRKLRQELNELKAYSRVTAKNTKKSKELHQKWDETYIPTQEVV